jgi:hypothetical protein
VAREITKVAVACGELSQEKRAAGFMVGAPVDRGRPKGRARIAAQQRRWAQIVSEHELLHRETQGASTLTAGALVIIRD